MRVAVVHYHLRIGGVTTVIDQAARALDALGVQVCVLAGERPAVELAAPAAVIPGLAYGRHELSASDILKQADEVASRLLGGAPDVWHIHNHSLGKNLVVPRLACALASAARPLVLQMHDFAEDGRPANYELLLAGLADGEPATLGPALYPRASHVHYAFLNRRDQHAFMRAGLPESRAHYLPNAVVSPPSAGEAPPRTDLVIYPTRAIRRKNVGEMVFWAALDRSGRRYALTRAPRNPEHAAGYNRWVDFSAARRLPVDFGLAEESPLSFPELMRSAACAITTSVAEGFGLAFLEPWLMDCPLTGRALPEIAEEFKNDGLDLSGLYDRLDVPLKWAGAGNLRSALQDAMRRVYASYRRELLPQDVEKAFNAAAQNDLVDFGRLDENMQQKVIEQVLNNPADAGSIRPGALNVPAAAVPINKDIVLAKYGPARYGQRLREIYRASAESGFAPEDALDADSILDQFLLPERFNLLRT